MGTGPFGGTADRVRGGLDVNAEDEELLRRLLDAYLPAPPPREDSGPIAVPGAQQGRPVVPEDLAELDEYQRLFVAEGATREYVAAVAAPWRSSGLSVREVRSWLDAGVYAHEPELAVALAGAGFDPREARATTVRSHSDSEELNVISAVRGRSEQAAWAAELRSRLVGAGRLAHRTG